MKGAQIDYSGNMAFRYTRLNDAVLDCLHDGTPLTATEIGAMVNASGGIVRKVLEQLRDVGLVEADMMRPGSRGQAPMTYKLARTRRTA